MLKTYISTKMQHEMQHELQRKKNVYFNKILNTNLPVCDIYQSQGLYKHILKRHPNCISYINNIADIIEFPDYIGQNSKEPNSLELVKCYSNIILIAIKFDIKENHMYVATLYELSNSKLTRRINSGRLKKIN